VGRNPYYLEGELTPLVNLMADVKALTEDERRLWEYIQKYDFEDNPWSTPAASKELEMDEDAVYKALSEIAKKLKGDIYLYYKNDGIRIAKS
jgi:hypothetical protein